jgi:5-methylphenazine-1-carboxylate 1-monooxygenase
VIYPISGEATRRGRSLINWVALLRVDGEPRHRRDWSHERRLEDFLPRFADWKFGFIDLPALFRATQRILEYPMVDRDPVDRWSFGRVTLLGDAAHPMYSVGSNGAAQAILDAQTLAAAVADAEGDLVRALLCYEEARLPATAAVVRSNRQFGPERVLQMVEERIRGPKTTSAISSRTRTRSCPSMPRFNPICARPPPACSLPSHRARSAFSACASASA